MRRAHVAAPCFHVLVDHRSNQSAWSTNSDGGDEYFQIEEPGFWVKKNLKTRSVFLVKMLGSQ